MLALFNLGSPEFILILALVLILLGARNLPGLGRGLRRGILEFNEAVKQVGAAADGEASEAGRSVAGIYGKGAAQALTSDNQVAELYDPAVLGGGEQRRGSLKRIRARLVEALWRLRRLVRTIWRAH